MNFKDIHIGELIKTKVVESKIDEDRLFKYLRCTERDLKSTYSNKSIPSDELLKWSKILEYDFFRIFSQHLIFYAPASAIKESTTKSSLPQFRKNIYTQEVIDFILELVKEGKKTKLEIIKEYNIPKTTLYKWISKHQK